jgi:FAD/FMN-containing dehydrogenase
VVLADGTVVDTLSPLRKTNTGLDWKQLFTGTSGLFGVVTAAVVQAVPLPRQRAAALVALADGDAALRLLRTLERELGDLLTAFEVMSAGALEPVFRHQERLRNPFDALPPYTALVEAATVLGEGRLALDSLLEETLGLHLEEAGEGVLDARFGRPEAFWALRHHVSESLRQEGRVLAFDIAVPRPRLPAFTQAVAAWLSETFPWVRVCDFGHWGDGGTHLNLVWTEAESDLPAGDLVDRLQERIYSMAVVEFQGSYSAEHGVGPHNQRFFEAFAPGPVKAAGAALKAHFDPGGLLGTARLW